MVVDTESGNCRVFSCPYHRWSYGTDGALRSVPLDYTFGDFNRSDFGLVELPVEVRHGFVWVIDRAGVDIDVGAWLGDEMDAILAGYRMDNLVSVTPHRFEHSANW